jgi:hypothetical protein
VRLEGLSQLYKYNDLIGNRTRYLPPCNVVPQRTTLVHDALETREETEVIAAACTEGGNTIESGTPDRQQSLLNIMHAQKVRSQIIKVLRLKQKISQTLEKFLTLMTLHYDINFFGQT